MTKHEGAKRLGLIGRLRLEDWGVLSFIGSGRVEKLARMSLLFDKSGWLLLQVVLFTCF